MSRTAEVWFVTGSQHLYGPETLKQVAADSNEIAGALSASPHIPAKIVFKPVLVSPESVTELMLAANAATECVGLIVWCHTFSPSKMWINGLKQLTKPAAHLHTQYNRDIPWSSIDMDFMNLNQAAHGDREHGFIWSRLRLNRKVVVGYWQKEPVQQKLGAWEGLRWLGLTGRARNSPASATTCARWPSPKATRSPRNSSSAISHRSRRRPG